MIITAIKTLATVKYGSYSKYARQKNIKQTMAARLSLERSINMAEDLGIKINISIDKDSIIDQLIFTEEENGKDNENFNMSKG